MYMYITQLHNNLTANNIHVDRSNSTLSAGDFDQNEWQPPGIGQQFGRWIMLLNDSANNLRDIAVGEGIACQLEQIIKLTERDWKRVDMGVHSVLYWKSGFLR